MSGARGHTRGAAGGWASAPRCVPETVLKPNASSGTLVAMKAATWFPRVHCIPTRTEVPVLLSFLILLEAPARARELANYAADMREDLADRILPYWHDTTIDRTN